MLLKSVHEGLHSPGNEAVLVKGNYEYYHYGCDGQDDRGWGCGYRTLQSLCSWVRLQKQQQDASSASKIQPVPTIHYIQNALVTMGDKPESIEGSRDWIGSFEVCLCLDYFYDVPCKIIHISKGADLLDHLETIFDHFETVGSPLMMGGDSDSSSKGVFGVCRAPPSLLIVDPHFYGNVVDSRQFLQDDNWVQWRPLSSFDDKSFYNICLPQLKAA